MRAVYLAFIVLAQLLAALPQPGQTFAVYGRVTTSDGSPVRRDVTVMATAIDGDMSFGQAVEPDGAFRLDDVTPGRYVLSVRPASAFRETEVAGEGGFALVTVRARDVGPINVRTRPMYSMAGRIRLESHDPTPVKPLWVNIFASSVFPRGAVETHLSRARVRPDGSFTLHNLIGPVIVRFGMEMQPGHFWYPGPVLLDGKDVTNVPTDFEERHGSDLEVVFTQRSSGLYGRTRDSSGAPVPGAYVIALSPEPSLQEVWSSTTTAAQADDEGRYRMFVPPGHYLVAAVDPSTFSSWDHARRNFAAVKGLASSVDVQDAVSTYRDLTLVKPRPPFRGLPQSRMIVRGPVWRAEEEVR